MRMQLNPHFLFNSFNVIATLLDAKPQPARARILLLALSDLYRRTLVASDREFMPMAEELALANDYLRIQGARFDGRLTHDIMCATDLAGMQVPALLLQPLVENAVVHGVADSRDQLRIWIHARTSDCGAGETAMLVEIGNETTGALSSSPGAGVGLRITRDRLAACYGDRARLDTRRTGPGSFDVRIRIPIPGVE
jgi:LytS/YehU family sensor histidine kinase